MTTVQLDQDLEAKLDRYQDHQVRREAALVHPGLEVVQGLGLHPDPSLDLDQGLYSAGFIVITIFLLKNLATQSLSYLIDHLDMTKQKRHTLKKSQNLKRNLMV